MKYQVYKGDKLIAYGTARDIAEKLGISVKTVYWYASPAARKRGKNATVAERIDNEV